MKIITVNLEVVYSMIEQSKITNKEYQKLDFMLVYKHKNTVQFLKSLKHNVLVNSY